jgi:mRNA interferase MazF
MVALRFDVVLATLDPTIGSEIRKTRPCLVVSPDQINRHLQTIIVAPMTTRGRSYPFRVPCRFQAKEGQIALDQVRTIDKSRVIRRLGTIAPKSQAGVLRVLRKMFAP